MSITIIIRETDKLGCAIYRESCITSKVLEQALRKSDPENKVEVVGAIWSEKQLSPQEAAEKGYREIKENNKDLFKK